MEEEPPKKYTKSAGIAAKKISDRYKKVRRKKKINIVEEIKDAASKKMRELQQKKFQTNRKK